MTSSDHPEHHDAAPGSVDPRSFLLRVEMVRSRMHAWHAAPDDPAYIDITDPESLDATDQRYVRADHPAISSYLFRIWTDGKNMADQKPDDTNELRRRAGLPPQTD